MKKHYLKTGLTAFFLYLLGVTILAGCTNKSKPSTSEGESAQWIARLDEAPQPKDIGNDSAIAVYLKYNQTVSGYEVTAKWWPFEKMVETGAVVINFHNLKSGKDYYYFAEKYHSFDTDKISFAKGFKGHNNGDIHYFDYTSPDTIDAFKDRNGNSPLGYYTPFQFLDIDFDGNDELLISDWYQGQAGNEYEVFKMAGDSLKKLDYIPLDRLTNVDMIDMKKKVIAHVSFSGADDTAIFLFSNKKREKKITSIPRFYSNTANSFDFEKYNSELGAPFTLDSIIEDCTTDGREHYVKYVVNNSAIRY